MKPATKARASGCVCCQIGDYLTAALIDVLDAAPPFDAVTIEASGVSDPDRIAEIARASPEFILDGVIVMVDVSAIMDQSRDPLLFDTLERQLLSADLIVANHCDRAGAEERTQALDWLAATTGGTPVHETSHAQAPLALLSGSARWWRWPCMMPNPAMPLQRAGDAGDPHHGAVFDTWSSRPERVLAQAGLRAWLAQLPPGLLRLKGIVRTRSSPAEQPRWSEIRIAGRRGTLIDAKRKYAQPAVVAIGLRGALPVADLSARFDLPEITD